MQHGVWEGAFSHSSIAFMRTTALWHLIYFFSCTPVATAIGYNVLFIALQYCYKPL